MSRLSPLGTALLAACVLAAPTPLWARADVSAAARWFAAHRDRPPMLRQFLQRMPKGADLHAHFSGSVYAESFLAWAAQDHDCVDEQRLVLVPHPCTPGGSLVAADGLDVATYEAMVDRISTRDLPYAGRSGHDQFFDTFGAFAPVGDDPRHYPAMLAELRTRAAAENLLHLELITSTERDCKDDQDRCLGNLARTLEWPDQTAADTAPGRDLSADFARMLEQLRAHGLAELVAEGRRNLTAREAPYTQSQGCDGPSPQPGCAVSVRWQQEAIRSGPPALVFTQLAYAFALAETDPRVVAINLVAPEDDPVALRDYDLHMRMVAFLSRQSPRVRITLHAGELTLGLVPPERLRGHIRAAVTVAGAQRIGHGVDIGYEDAAVETLRTMQDRGIAVEVCLTSNDVILGVRGGDHPFPDYLAAGVPVVLASDDEGVSRIDLTNEYLRAARDYGLGYRELKQLSRNGLTYSFLPGASLWGDAAGARPVAACTRDEPGSANPSQPCRRWLADSEKARRQWALEAAFQAFEGSDGWKP